MIDNKKVALVWEKNGCVTLRWYYQPNFHEYKLRVCSITKVNIEKNCLKIKATIVSEHFNFNYHNGNGESAERTFFLYPKDISSIELRKLLEDEDYFNRYEECSRTNQFINFEKDDQDQGPTPKTIKMSIGRKNRMGTVIKNKPVTLKHEYGRATLTWKTYRGLSSGYLKKLTVIGDAKYNSKKKGTEIQAIYGEDRGQKTPITFYLYAEEDLVTAINYFNGYNPANSMESEEKVVPVETIRMAIGKKGSFWGKITEKKKKGTDIELLYEEGKLCLRFKNSEYTTSTLVLETIKDPEKKKKRFEVVASFRDGGERDFFWLYPKDSRTPHELANYLRELQKKGLQLEPRENKSPQTVWRRRLRSSSPQFLRLLAEMENTRVMSY